VSGADWIIVAFILLSVITAARQGFFYEIFSLAGVVVGYVLAVWQYYRVAAWFEPYVKAEWVADLLGFVIVFVAVAGLAVILGRIVRRFVKEVGLSWFDRFLGGIFGVVRGCLIVSVLLVAQASFAPTAKWLAGSEFAPYFLVVGRAAIWVAPSQLRARFYQGLDLLHRAQPPSEASGKPGPVPGK
jgi:membrane protein required for colicin V production